VTPLSSNLSVLLPAVSYIDRKLYDLVQFHNRTDRSSNASYRASNGIVHSFGEVTARLKILKMLTESSRMTLHAITDHMKSTKSGLVTVSR